MDAIPAELKSLLDREKIRECVALLARGEDRRDADLDRLEKRGSDWRIAKRTMLYDWYQDFGESADWSKGVMGAPLRADRYAGRAVGDFSGTFFGH